MLTAMPSSFSLSPWRKNSSSTRLDHLRDASHGLVGLLMSAACMSVLTSISRSLGLSRHVGDRGLGSSTLPLSAGGAVCSERSTRASIWSLRGKCWAMSVARMALITVRRRALFCAGASGRRMSHLASRRMSKVRAQWWCSSTHWSLYMSASSLCVFTWKEFPTPGWSASCASAETMRANTSRSLMYCDAPMVVVSTYAVWVTSTT
mmetsp:Transcript_1407/g.4833  ORF Transcript_1407/g.4833 Transcript_1407/m.4833 type:complete len:206 (+) Transcript_1407:424-1041(+)